MPVRREILLENFACDRIGFVIVTIIAASYKVRGFIVVLVSILVVQLEMDPTITIRSTFPWFYGPVDDKLLNDP
jgi:hypothetical protein